MPPRGGMGNYALLLRVHGIHTFLYNRTGCFPHVSAAGKAAYYVKNPQGEIS